MTEWHWYAIWGGWIALLVYVLWRQGKDVEEGKMTCGTCGRSCRCEFCKWDEQARILGE